MDLSQAQHNRMHQLNELDELRLDAIEHTTIIQQQRAKWHDQFIKSKYFQEGYWDFL